MLVNFVEKAARSCYTVNENRKGKKIKSKKERKRSMKKHRKKAILLGKVLLVLLMVFSQLYMPLSVFAEEVNEVKKTEEVETQNAIDNNEKTTTLEPAKETVDNQTEPTTEKEQTIDKQETNKDNLEESIEEVPTINSEEQTPENKETTEEKQESQTTNEVKTEESTPEETIVETSNTYKVTINGEETEEYSLTGENKTVTIHQEYDGEAGTYHFSHPLETEEIDYTNKLYGKYRLEYKVLSTEDNELASKTITVNYEGDNNEILRQFSNEVNVYENHIGLYGTNKHFTVGEIKNKFNLTELNNQYNARIIAKNNSGEELNDENEVTNEVVFILTNDEVEEEFIIDIYGDYNDDKILDIEDAKIIVDNILNTKKDEEQDQPISSILEAGNTVYRNGIWNEVTEVKDSLSNSLTNKKEAYRGEEFTVKYIISGFENDKINGIEGTINYNKEVLELVGIEIENIHGGINDENKFVYLLEDYNSSDVLMTIKFKGISTGDANISIDNILASVGGIAANLEESISTKVTIIEAGIGGDVEETTQEVVAQETAKPATQTTQTYSNSYSSYIKPIALSSDSKIKHLEIKGYKIDFDPNTYEYAIRVKNNVKSLDLTVILNDVNATYEVFGNENFKVGENTVEIKVKAEDGSTSTYKIKVTREKKEKEEVEEKEEKNNSKPIIIALIILVIIGLIYVIFKDDEEDEKENK